MSLGSRLLRAGRSRTEHERDGAERQNPPCGHGCTPFNSFALVASSANDASIAVRVMRAQHRLAQPRLVVFRAERGVEERRIVRAERDPHPARDQARQRMGGAIGIQAERHVAAGADFQRDAAPRQFLDAAPDPRSSARHGRCGSPAGRGWRPTRSPAPPPRRHARCSPSPSRAPADRPARNRPARTWPRRRPCRAPRHRDAARPPPAAPARARGRARDGGCRCAMMRASMPKSRRARSIASTSAPSQAA